MTVKRKGSTCTFLVYKNNKRWYKWHAGQTYDIIIYHVMRERLEYEREETVCVPVGKVSLESGVFVIHTYSLPPWLL